MSEASPQLVADRYRLISPLGQGGMGRVWKARDEVLHRDVAIKELVPPPGLTNDERREMRERSLREARAIARLNNINVVRIFDVLRTDGDPWIVMEYVASRSLQDTIAEDGPLPPARVVEIGLGVLNALKAAHKAGIMHRDVKPGNVLLGTDGRVVLTDFGLATIPGDPNVTRTGMVLGSPAYIAPERARDGTFGPEADLWSLGATLYAAVEGKSPYARPSAISTLAALATEPVPPARNAGPLKQVLAGLLRKDPQERITAEAAERMLRKAGGRRSRISLLDGVRRPGPNGPREPRPPLVPAPRPSGERPASPVTPPAPRTPPTSGLLAGGVAAAGSSPDRSTGVQPGSDVDPTAKIAGPVDRVDAAPTAKVSMTNPSEAAAVDAESERSGAASPTSTGERDTALAAAAGTASTAAAAGDTTEPATPGDEQAGTDGSGGERSDSGSTGADATQTGATANQAHVEDAESAAPAGTDTDGTQRATTTVDSAVSGTSAATATGASGGAVRAAAESDGGTRVGLPTAGDPRRTPQPTSVMPAASVSPAPARGSVFKAGQFRSERARRAVLVGALVAVLLLGLAVVVPLLTGGDEDGGSPPVTDGTSSASPPATSAPAAPPSAASPSPSVSPSPSASPSATQSAGGLPEGWTLRTDPVGFKVPVPDGWRRSARGTWVLYKEPNGVRELLIDRTDRPQRDAAAAWRAIEPGRKNLVRNYEFISIQEIDCKWRTCADWDWRESRDNTRIRTRNRGFVTASNRGFALRWEVADREWDAQLANFEMIFREFVPDRQD
ncbi:protein kinase domain-containing protein [Micromonospora sp. DT48]|uniref:serine/threonine-protein kinase n=1 Tax=unclassified Micromonospora TaxID=2617518 RepID=UPI0012BD6CFA|nr:serine/threonine-protein kinase [Micromonospora sp. CP22]MTK01363.1 serine/threonine protein kinase [Micromonospora sp. CP22]